jgi:hypothetical protein
MARDRIHTAVKNALVKDGWTITDDPFYLKDKRGELELEADLAAERPIAAERGNRKIAVEIKSFLGRSLITEFYAAFGQYRTYAHLLSEIEPERELFLAVSSTVFKDFFQLETIQEIARKDGLSLLAVNIQTEEITQWINWRATAK